MHSELPSHLPPVPITDCVAHTNAMAAATMKGEDGKTFHAGKNEDGEFVAAVARGENVGHMWLCAGRHAPVPSRSLCACCRHEADSTNLRLLGFSCAVCHPRRTICHR